MMTLLKLIRNICICICCWMCSSSCLFGWVAYAVPLEYVDDHEFSYDMDTAQSKVKYDPKLLSQQLKDQPNRIPERAAPCYSAMNKYTHGQRVFREDPCEVCLCVDGEIFCWWKKCDNPKRRKFKLEKSPRLGKSNKGRTVERVQPNNKEQQHLKKRKKYEKKLRQQHWQQQQQLHTSARSKILTFPENLPSVLYYDYKTEDQHGLYHGTHKKPSASTDDGNSNVGGQYVARTSISAIGLVVSRESNEEDATPSAAGAVEPSSNEMKFGTKIHSRAQESKKPSLQQTSTARITTTNSRGSTVTTVPAASPPSEALSKDIATENRLNAVDQFISGHPVGDIQALNIDTTSHTTDVGDQTSYHHTTGTQGKMFMTSQSQEIDRDGILRDAKPATSDISGSRMSYNSDTNNLYKDLLNGSNGESGPPIRSGTVASFRSSYNDFSSEFNTSSGVDLDLIIGRNSEHDTDAIILEADSILNASSLTPKHDMGGLAVSNNNINNLNLSNNNIGTDHQLVSTTTTMASTTIAQDQDCIVMGASYKIGAVLPQETGNCLQCVCIEGATKDDSPRVTCSPHNCPPLVLPDLFDATGY